MTKQKNYMDFLDEALDLETMLEEIEGPGEEFAENVLTTLRSMVEWVEENEHVTEKQWRALENWREGAEKWLS